MSQCSWSRSWWRPCCERRRTAIRPPAGQDKACRCGWAGRWLRQALTHRCAPRRPAPASTRSGNRAAPQARQGRRRQAGGCPAGRPGPSSPPGGSAWSTRSPSTSTGGRRSAGSAAGSASARPTWRSRAWSRTGLLDADRAAAGSVSPTRPAPIAHQVVRSPWALAATVASQAERGQPRGRVGCGRRRDGRAPAAPLEWRGRARARCGRRRGRPGRGGCWRAC
jgi:hypothetical protein